MKLNYALICVVMLAMTASADADPIADGFWLLGDFTQNKPCKGDGSDPAELKVKISTQQINSKVGICKILDAEDKMATASAPTSNASFPPGLLSATSPSRGNPTIQSISSIATKPTR